MKGGVTGDSPLGNWNSCFSAPDLIARLNWLSKAVPGDTFALFARMYFFRAERLVHHEISKVSITQDALTR